MEPGIKWGIVISSYHHLGQALERFRPEKVISILSEAESKQLPPVSFGSRQVCRLKCDDLGYSSRQFLAPQRADIEALIKFATEWAGIGTIVIHCRAGVSRSSAAGLIAAATIWPSRLEFLVRIARAKNYYRQNTTMLGLADDVLGTNLVGLVRGLPPPEGQDNWGPAFIPID